VSDVVTELVALVHAYHWRWIVVHGEHGLDCELCRGLHEQHAWTLVAMQTEPDNGHLDLEAAV
jgi:hypothetical protein